MVGVVCYYASSGTIWDPGIITTTCTGPNTDRPLRQLPRLAMRTDRGLPERKPSCAPRDVPEDNSAVAHTTPTAMIAGATPITAHLPAAARCPLAWPLHYLESLQVKTLSVPSCCLFQLSTRPPGTTEGIYLYSNSQNVSFASKHIKPLRYDLR